MDYISFLFHIALVVPMTNVLVAMARVFGGNFGVAIIIFTLGMRFITWPLTSSQYRASRAMQAIQPQVQELQKKYKGKDPKKLQSEMTALYREAGVNPLGCVVPMLVQFPIWIALYQVIRTSLGSSPESVVTLSQNLYPFSFVHTAVPLNTHLLFWDLGQPDVSYMLPLLVGITMYVQQKMITPPPTAAATSQQAQQQQQTQQMMTWMMPLMFGFMSTTVPAGLALYWFMSNLSGVVFQYFYMGRQIEWRSMLTLGPAPAPAAKARGQRPDEQQRLKPAGKPEGAEARPEVEGEGGPTGQRGPEARRKRHGRRRGKR